MEYSTSSTLTSVPAYFATTTLSPGFTTILTSFPSTTPPGPTATTSETTGFSFVAVETIRGLVGRVEERSPVTLAEYRTRLENKLREVLASTTIDESRILTEAAIFADRIAVDEETVRLRSHLAQLDSLLAGGGAIGRKLDFLLQEMNREANTIGSKGNDLEQARTVVEIKAELEKIREQIQNIE